MYCLDSDALIAILRGDKAIEDLVEKIDESRGASTTVINAYEILFGAKRSLRKEESLRETRKLLSKLNVLEMNSESSEIASDIFALLSKEGRIIGIRDVFIASIFLSNGYSTLITRNEKDFSKIKGLKVQKW